MKKHLVLVGGGHAHMTTLLHLADYIKRGHRVTLISPSPYHYYSGMGPGMLSGLYEDRQVRFHIQKMAMDRGGVFIEDRVARIDPGNRMLFLAAGGSIAYDVASFNVGSEVPLDGIAAPQERIIPVKPISNLRYARHSILEEMHEKRLRLLVVGGGAAGVEISGNLWRLVHGNGGSAEITLVAGEQLLKSFPSKVRRLALASLSSRNISVLEGMKVQTAGNLSATCSDSSSFPYDYAFIAVGVKPPALFRDSGLPLGQDGAGLLVNRRLQSVAYPELFGGGDCISLEGHRLARVGVYAVRQNPVLHCNLMAALEGAEMKVFSPDGSYMLIMNMGNDRGILWKNGWVFHGRLAFVLKDFIDRRFMNKFRVSGEMTGTSND
ncbi:MAG: FAD-dependent oxidoreductase [Syntrophobacteraceae bacterium]|jgi:NADH dehydrogenase FAD-containing subunit